MSTPTTAAHHLEGLELDDGWQVLGALPARPDRSGGAFSVSYLARHRSGMLGFVKAFDYAAALEDEDPARALGDITATFNAERDLLDQCGGRNLRRVVRALGFGTVRVTGYAPNAVSYLILELADGDARDVVGDTDTTEQIPMLRLAHHVAVGMNQLHSIGAAHQDLKPANVLVWRAPDLLEGKVGDLGCAFVEGRPAPHDDLPVAGDCSYAAPDALYRAVDLVDEQRRRVAADMFMFGNLLCYLLTEVRYSAILFGFLDRSQHWSRFDGTFHDVLPGLVDAHGLALDKLRDALLPELCEDVLRMLDELCHPDPRRRGDPVAHRRGHHPYRLDRYVSRLDLLYRRASIRAA